MTVYIILFRGVGGATQLPTKPLREALRRPASRMSRPTSTVATRAVIEEGRRNRAADVGEDREKGVRFRQGCLCGHCGEWRGLIENNPFPDALAVPKFLHAAVLDGKPDEEKVEALRAFAKAGERIAVVGKVAYIHTPGGFGTSKLAVKFDKGIGVPNTARNWNTVLALAEMADAIK